MGSRFALCRRVLKQKPPSTTQFKRAVLGASVALATMSVACEPPGSELSDGLGEFETSEAALTSANGLNSNGLGSNGLNSNGLPANGLPANGLGSNGLNSNGLPANGLNSNGLGSNGIGSAQFGNWFHWFQGCGSGDGCSSSGSTGSGTATSRAAAGTIMKYVVTCACPAGKSFTYTDRAGTTHTWTGVMGLAPTWCPASGTPAAATVEEQEWVSACLLGLINRNGSLQGSIQISMSTGGLERAYSTAPTPLEAQLYSDYPTHYYGNIFYGAGSSKLGGYMALHRPMDAYTNWITDADGVYTDVTVYPPGPPTYGSAPLADVQDLGRDCAVDGCGGAAIPTGFAYLAEHGTFTDTYGRTPPQANKCGSDVYWDPNAQGGSWLGSDNGYVYNCRDNQDRKWDRVMTVKVAQFQELRSGCDFYPDEWSPYAFKLTSASGCTAAGPIKVDSYYFHPGDTLAPGVYQARFRYKSPVSAKVKLRFRVTNRTGSGLSSWLENVTPATVTTLPGTNGTWQWGSIPFTTTKTGNYLEYSLIYADSTSSNLRLNAGYIALDYAVPPATPAGAELIQVWQQDTRRAPNVGDWDSGYWKGDCPSGQGLSGLSTQSGPNRTHRGLCGAVSPSLSHSTYSVLSATAGNNRLTSRLSDWDSGYSKIECGANQHLAGISVDPTTYRVHAALCGTGTTNTTSNCQTVTVDNSANHNFASPDWDSGYYKHQCPAGKAAVGFSVPATAGTPRRLLCCSY